MNPLYRHARFLTSAAVFSQAPPDVGVEIAFAGRSNAGKSSAINTICQQKNLARTSKTPGRTQLLNFFLLDDQRRLVDLPGYGYAKVPEARKLQWQRELSRYLERRASLRGLILLMDARHPLKAFDRQMLEWCAQQSLALHILLTKADKLKRGAATKTLQEVKRAARVLHPQASVQLFSALKSQGIEQAQAVLDQWFEADNSAQR